MAQPFKISKSLIQNLTFFQGKQQLKSLDNSWSYIDSTLYAGHHMQDHMVHIFDMVLTSDNGQPGIALFVQDPHPLSWCWKRKITCLRFCISQGHLLTGGILIPGPENEQLSIALLLQNRATPPSPLHWCLNHFFHEATNTMQDHNIVSVHIAMEILRFDPQMFINEIDFPRISQIKRFDILEKVNNV